MKREIHVHDMEHGGDGADVKENIFRKRDGGKGGDIYGLTKVTDPAKGEGAHDAGQNKEKVLNK